MIEFFKDHQSCHSEFQMDHFITTKGGNGHPYGMYKQCLRQLHGRFCNLIKKYETEERTLALRDQEREFARFYTHAVHLKRTHIGELTPERRAELDRDMWHHQHKVMLAIDLICHERASAGWVERLLCLPIDMRREALEWLEDKSSTMKWFLTYEPPRLDLVPDEHVDVRQLVMDTHKQLEVLNHVDVVEHSEGNHFDPCPARLGSGQPTRELTNVDQA